ncbi:MAG TPA: hypothetical protein PK880_08205 [Candidatus Competibacter sp.]|mgnify:CR=1 FL=1|nr:hypothetical protein [Candidatus Competibacter sp.]
MNDGNDVEIRRARLRALRERYEQTAVTAVDSRAENGWERATSSSERLPVPIRRRAAGAGGRAAGTDGQAAGGGLLARVAAFLTQEGPDARFVAGTAIREDRLGKLLQFLKRRGAAANGQQAQRARAILAYLTESEPDGRMVAGVNITRAVALLERAREQRPPAGKGAVLDFPAEREIIEGDVLAVDADAAPERVEDGGLPELARRAQRLSEELLAVQQQILKRVSGHAEAAEPGVVARPDLTARPADSKPSPPADGEWYMDFLD